MNPRARPDITCGCCRQPIADQEHVAVHLPCFALIDDQLAAAAAAFVRARPDTPVCHACLARALRITVEDARTTMIAVRLADDDCYFVVGERCGICRRDAATIQYAAQPAANEPQAA